MAISYFDVWKKKMDNNGGSVTQSKINTSKDFFNRNFKDDPSYKLAKLRTKDLTIADSDLDTRVVNVDTNTKKKKIYVRPNTNIEVGDYIVYPNKTYLALEVEDNLISPYASVELCNHLFKWMYKGIIHEAYGIGTNQTKYTLGTDSIREAGIIESDSRYSILFPNSIKCKTIKVGQRFLFNDSAWKVTQIEYVSSQDNIRSLLLGQDSINTEIDDVQGEVAGKWANKHTYTYNIPTSFEVAKDKTYTLNYSIINELGKDFDYSLVNVKSESNLISVTKDNNKLIIKGLEIGVNSIKLEIPTGETSKQFIISFEVKSDVVAKVEYGTPDFSNGTVLRQACATTIKCTKYLGGILQDLEIEWELDDMGQGLLANKKINVVGTKKSNEVQIRNIGVSVKTDIQIIIKDKNSVDKTVVLKQIINLIK